MSLYFPSKVLANYTQSLENVIIISLNVVFNCMPLKYYYFIFIVHIFFFVYLITLLKRNLDFLRSYYQNS